jgi:predicted homoserine dehydrogenase-like protein
VVESTIAANAIGLSPDIDTLHAPFLHVAEIPEVLCPEDSGGILKGPNVIDAVVCLRHPHEAGLGGGVFVVVGCENDYSRDILITKGLLSNANGSAALIYRPYHLCGVETPLSIVCAGMLEVPTGTTEYTPRFDVVAKAVRDLKADDLISDSGQEFQLLVRKSRPITDNAPLPYHIGTGNRLAVDVSAGSILTVDMISRPKDSMLWKLRNEQDRFFLRP